MPPRRPHKKSRNGCDQCKKRRVKCDENGPPCLQCARRELPCDYSRAVKRSATNPATSLARPIEGPCYEPSLPSNSLSPVSASPFARKTALRDLELMHKFSTETYKSLSIEDSEEHVWQMVLPRKALGYDFLMNGMLALASLHIATSLSPPAALSYIDTALEYYNMAIAPFRQALDNITPVNCEPVLAHSVITTALGIALPQMTADHEQGSSMTENIIFVFELLQGAGNIFKITRSWLREGTIFASKSDFWARPAADRLDDDKELALKRLACLNDDTLDTANPEKHRINQDAISLLHRCFRRFTLSSTIDAVLAWLAMVDKDFVVAVQRREPLPVLILMHWGVLLHELDGRRWWARNSGKALIFELSTAIEPQGVQWEEALHWPQRSIGS
ncbi:hypothetical protein CIHG_06372 [Coccidioides immitis H538.4]|uniref:Zn(2)-C6 fungal-type domain-containing protein n=1 Tax=Coccidioides immitis H538.4 TaxID=396776 RepID=A0A0J8RVH6_COCIT|nr:hypothetical protein CIHG_06372 [Coccidioides immitis H538.4]